jgi:hypothetical protein
MTFQVNTPEGSPGLDAWADALENALKGVQDVLRGLEKDALSITRYDSQQDWLVDRSELYALSDTLLGLSQLVGSLRDSAKAQEAQA